MKIGGLQKLTLLDYPDVMACIVFTEGCNFRCPFCHNASLVLGGADGGAPTEDEVLAFLRKRRGLLDGVVVTGGEPLIWQDAEDFLVEVRKLGYKIKLDTNGSMPERLRGLIERGRVDYVAMDIKNSPRRYDETAGRHVEIGAILESAALLLEGRVDYEFRTTVVKPLFDADCFREIGAVIKGAKKYFLQKFKDSGDLIAADGLSAYSDEEMNEFLAAVRPFVPNAKIR